MGVIAQSDMPQTNMQQGESRKGGRMQQEVGVERSTHPKDGVHAHRQLAEVDAMHVEFLRADERYSEQPRCQQVPASSAPPPAPAPSSPIG